MASKVALELVRKHYTVFWNRKMPPGMWMHKYLENVFSISRCPWYYGLIKSVNSTAVIDEAYKYMPTIINSYQLSLIKFGGRLAFALCRPLIFLAGNRDVPLSFLKICFDQLAGFARVVINEDFRDQARQREHEIIRIF